MSKLLETKIHEEQEKSTNDKHIHHKEHIRIQESPHHQVQQRHGQSLSYNVNLQYNPQTPEAEKSTKLTVNITEQESGDVMQEFETIHDKLMHIIIVGEDLSYFAHIHPTLQTSHSNFTTNHTFP